MAIVVEADEVLAVPAVVVELATVVTLVAVVTLVLGAALVAVGNLRRHLAALGTINVHSGALIINRYSLCDTWTILYSLTRRK